MATAADEELVNRVTTAVEREAPDGWRRIVLSMWATVAVTQTEFAVTMADGSRPDISPRSPDTELAELRSAMYVPDRGTWFSARFELNVGREPEARFNFDDDPQWFPDVPSWVFSRDLAAFPRADEHIPDWLRQRLDEAGQMMVPPEANQ